MKSSRNLILLAIVVSVIFLIASYFFLNNINLLGGSPSPTLSPEEIKQGQDDRASAIQEQKFLDTHQWYDKIPSPNNKYFIGYDQEKNEFFVDLYSTTTSQTESYKNEVLSVLKSIGVDTNQYKIVWTVTSK